MGMTRKATTSDAAYQAGRERYLKNREVLLAKAKERYQEEREVRLETAQKIRNAAREARLLVKRRIKGGGWTKAIEKARGWVREFKEGKPCMDCQQSFPFYVLDFDHVRGNKGSDISGLVGKGASIHILAREVAKCELVCSNCHRERTFRRRIDLK